MKKHNSDTSGLWGKFICQHGAYDCSFSFVSRLYFIFKFKIHAMQFKNKTIRKTHISLVFKGYKNH
jgi:hypothetical protein